MDTLDRYRDIIESVLTEYTKIKYAWGDVKCRPVFDRRHDGSALITVGWNGRKRTHYCLVHIEIAGGKIWIQEDGIEHGIVTDLERAGIPKEDIVLGFQPPDVRPLTEYAAA
jgi:XisI protein